jgi:hypothetical protein
MICLKQAPCGPHCHQKDRQSRSFIALEPRVIRSGLYRMSQGRRGILGGERPNKKGGLRRPDCVNAMIPKDQSE